MDLNALREALAGIESSSARGAAVLIPLLAGPDSWEVLLEVRAQTLAVQPGEVCLPGGGIEADESPRAAAIRETCEELLVREGQIVLLGELGAQPGPGGRPLHVFVGELRGYDGSFSPSEVERTFTVPLDWLLAHEPAHFEVRMEPRYPDDFPWELVPGGRHYPWRAQKSDVPFYLGTDPVIWGATARVLARFSHVLREHWA